MTRIHRGPADGGLVREIHTATVAGGATSVSITTGIKRIMMVNYTNQTGRRADGAIDWTTTAGTVAIAGDFVVIEALGN